MERKRPNTAKNGKIVLQRFVKAHAWGNNDPRSIHSMAHQPINSFRKKGMNSLGTSSWCESTCMSLGVPCLCMMTTSPSNKQHLSFQDDG
jgi:hypothetical protein